MKVTSYSLLAKDPTVPAVTSPVEASRMRLGCIDVGTTAISAIVMLPPKL